jgi:hypothetical protein
MFHFRIHISDKTYPKTRRKIGAKLNPYINLKDNTRAAMEFYQSVFGGKLAISTFKEFKVHGSPLKWTLLPSSDQPEGLPCTEPGS